MQPADPREPLVVGLTWIIRHLVRILAILMTFVILLGVVDVAWVVSERLAAPPVYVLTGPDLLATFGAFMTVLIAIEIFVNIVLYLREDVIHVKLVLATALMAVARKVIILDIGTLSAAEVLAVAAVVIGTAVAYRIVHLPGATTELEGSKAERPPPLDPNEPEPTGHL